MRGIKFLTECVLNVFYSFVPNKVITIRSKDTLWMIPEIREWSLKKQKSISVMLSMVKVLLTIKFFVTLPQGAKVPLEAKSNYFSLLRESLNGPAITPKKYWLILHNFLYKRKIPKIPAVRYNNTFLTDTIVKTNTLKSF